MILKQAKSDKNASQLFVTIAFSLFALSSFSQQKNIPLNRFFTQEIERVQLKDTINSFHSAVKPVCESSVDLREVYGFKKDTMKIYNKAIGKLLKHHLFEVQKDDYFLALDPLFDFTVGNDFADTTSYGNRSLFVNQRGLQLIGDIGKKFSFQTSFYETQTFAPLYFKKIVDATGVYPGFGRTKVYNLNGYDFGMSNGWISYSPTNWLNLQFGQGKNFIGHGYRSLLLSDAAFSYPYLRALLQSPNKKFQYTAIYASMQTLERLPKGEVPESLFKRKGASFNYLSWTPNNKIEIGLFEGIIWERYDSTGTKFQPYGGFIPVIGVNTLIQGYESKHHVMTGANIKIRTSKHSMVYGQLATDGPAKSRFGFQLGAKYYDLLLPNLDVQLELNNLSDNLYTSHYPLQSYTHTNQPLGHPTGPATSEILTIINYRYHRFIAQCKYNYLLHSTGPEGDWANDPKVIWETFTAWPVHKTQQLDLSLGFFINPKTNFQAMIGYTNRNDMIDYNWMDDSTMQTSYVYVSFRTNLINRYADF